MLLRLSVVRDDWCKHPADLISRICFISMDEPAGLMKAVLLIHWPHAGSRLLKFGMKLAYTPLSGDAFEQPPRHSEHSASLHVDLGFQVVWPMKLCQAAQNFREASSSSSLMPCIGLDCRYVALRKMEVLRVFDVACPPPTQFQTSKDHAENTPSDTAD